MKTSENHRNFMRIFYKFAIFFIAVGIHMMVKNNFNLVSQVATLLIVVVLLINQLFYYSKWGKKLIEIICKDQDL